MNKLELWQRYKDYVCDCESLGLSLDISRMSFAEAFFEEMSGPIKKAFLAMDAIEGGAKANASEDRMVGHYWLRTPELAPNDAIRADIKSAIDSVKAFAAGVHEGSIKPKRGDGFYVVLVVGIGGSALGPQLLSDALGSLDDQMIIRFIDNTDPDGIDRILGELDESIAETLTLVVSKSGGTKETRNAMLEVAAAYKRSGLDFAKHAVAITASGSALDKQAIGENWLATFPMWDWVGGRTSVTSAVGLLPAALQGIDIDSFLAGARECDEVTRQHDARTNPAALLVVRRGGRLRIEGHGDPSLQGSIVFVRAILAATRDGVCGKERGSGGEGCPSGADRVWQQGQHGSARIRAAIARWSG